MNKKTLVFISTGIGLVLSLVLVNVLSWNILESETIFHLFQLLKSLLIALISIVSVKLINLIFIKPIEIRRGNKIPSVIKDVIAIVVCCVGAIIIIQNVYDESVFGMLSLLAGSGVVLGIASKDFLEKIISGFALDFQNDFKVGDWIKFSNGTVAQIKKMKLTGIDLACTDKTLMHISNTTLTNQTIINLNNEFDPFILNIDIILDKNINIDKTRTILLNSLNKVSLSQSFVVVKGFQKNGIPFGLYFKLMKNSYWPEIRHDIIKNLIEDLKKYNLPIKEISGDFRIKKIKC